MVRVRGACVQLVYTGFHMSVERLAALCLPAVCAVCIYVCESVACTIHHDAEVDLMRVCEREKRKRGLFEYRVSYLFLVDGRIF